ncbi:hypothetical protein FIU85_16635 [Roseovarius sp. THAF8]|uniref:hypothetical protein n=1 Tax=Roseovarius sp. THAF8 TaxID=2587846 RepID=UPI0012A90B68|nr:hypothetical protein [Roseovarius sp. THAF8]QFT98942.1 hypothetical protein FIU85_16635 [Roseovarius sp. THAF8]
MSLRFRLVFTLWLVTALAAAITLGLAAADAYRTARSDTQTTLTRASYVLERNYHMEPRVGDPLYAEMTSIKLLGVMAPGTYIRFDQRMITGCDRGNRAGPDCRHRHGPGRAEHAPDGNPAPAGKRLAG